MPRHYQRSMIQWTDNRRADDYPENSASQAIMVNIVALAEIPLDSEALLARSTQGSGQLLKERYFVSRCIPQGRADIRVARRPD